MSIAQPMIMAIVMVTGQRMEAGLVRMAIIVEIEVQTQVQTQIEGTGIMDGAVDLTTDK